MKQTQLCLASIALLTASGQAVFAAAPDLSEWTVSDGTASTDVACFSGYTCGETITGNGFFQRQVTDADGNDYFQTIITESNPDSTISFTDETFIADESPLKTPLALNCPSDHKCSNIIFGEGYEQQEFTDGDNLWLQSANTDESNPLISTTFSSWDSTPLHLFHTEPKITLKPGPYLTTMDSNTLQRQPKNLQLERDNLPLDPDHTELNQQSTAEQQIYNQVLDIELAERVIGRTMQLGTQLNAPLNIPDSYQLQLRILSNGSWNNFAIDENNFVSSAVKFDTGFCPDINSDLYQTNFDSSSECLRISIQDGGINDSDNTNDGRIRLTLGIILKATELQTTSPTAEEEADQTQPGSGGGGSWSLFLSIYLILRHFSKNTSSHYSHSANRLGERQKTLFLIPSKRNTRANILTNRHW